MVFIVITICCPLEGKQNVDEMSSTALCAVNWSTVCVTRTAPWRSWTGRSTSSSWPRASTSLLRRSRTSTWGATQWPRCLCMGTAYRYGGGDVGRTRPGSTFCCWLSLWSPQSCLVAVVIPDPDFLPSWAKKTLGLQGTYQELCDTPVRCFLLTPLIILPQILLIPDCSMTPWVCFCHFILKSLISFEKVTANISVEGCK